MTAALDVCVTLKPVLGLELKGTRRLGQKSQTCTYHTLSHHCNAGFHACMMLSFNRSAAGCRLQDVYEASRRFVPEPRVTVNDCSD